MRARLHRSQHRAMAAAARRAAALAVAALQLCALARGAQGNVAECIRDLCDANAPASATVCATARPWVRYQSACHALCSQVTSQASACGSRMHACMHVEGPRTRTLQPMHVHVPDETTATEHPPSQGLASRLWRLVLSAGGEASGASPHNLLNVLPAGAVEPHVRGHHHQGARHGRRLARVLHRRALRQQRRRSRLRRQQTLGAVPLWV